MPSQKLLVDVSVDMFTDKNDVLQIYTAAFQSYSTVMD
jgi:hypothetical protein